ncbi:MAG: putative Ig domain-containing protein [Pirellulaceae bacterium]
MDPLFSHPNILVGTGLEDGLDERESENLRRFLEGAPGPLATSHSSSSGTSPGQLPDLPDGSNLAVNYRTREKEPSRRDSQSHDPNRGIPAPAGDLHPGSLTGRAAGRENSLPSAHPVPATTSSSAPESTAITNPAESSASPGSSVRSAMHPRQTLDLGFPRGLTGWNIRELGGSAQQKGSVTAGSAILREGNSFLVTLDQDLIIPQAPLNLTFTYEATFDTSDPASINDAFEAVLMAADGSPLVQSFAGGRDAFFNLTEQMSSALGTGTTETAVAEGKRVATDISQIPPGTAATLLFRLVNNDADVDTTVHILDVQLTSGDDHPPVVTVDLFQDTAPEGPGSESYRTDLHTNDVRVIGTATDDQGVALLEVQTDEGPFADITASLTDGQYSFDPGALTPGLHTLKVRATDTLSQVTQGAITFTVNAPPVADAGGNRTVNEGDTETFDGSGSTDPEADLFRYEWGFHDATSVISTVSSYSYLQDGAFPVTLSVTDTAGSVASQEIQVQVSNVAPTVLTATDLSGGVGAPLDFTATFSDPGVFDTHTALVHWGDGTTSTGVVTESNGQGTVSAGHAYTSGGTYSVRIEVIDDAGAASERLATAVIVAGETSSLGGYVYLDVNNNGIKDPPERALPNIPITLAGSGEWTIVTATDGSYLFDNLPPGRYSLRAAQPLAFLDGRDTPGSPRLGAVANDRFFDIALAAGVQATGYNFGELGLRPELMGKHLFLASTPTAEQMIAEMTVAGGRWFAFQAGDTGLLTAAIPQDVGAPVIEVYTQGMMPLALSEGEHTVSVPIEDGAAYVLHVAGQTPTSEFTATLRLEIPDPTLPPPAHPQYYTNIVNALDTNADGTVSPLDALLIINALNQNGQVSAEAGLVFLDVTGDENLSPLDALWVINYLNFSHQIDIAAGTNTFLVEAQDAAGQSTTQSVTVGGTQLAEGEVDFAQLSVVSGSALGLYGRTSWHDASSVLYADFGVENRGQYTVDGPLLVGVTNISDPSVRLRDPEGTTPDGIPYFDMSTVVPGGSLRPGDSSGLETISFYAPARARFTYDLVFFAGVNQAPRITTVPDIEALGGQPYAYDVDAIDADGDTLTFSLVAAPDTMTVHADTGEIIWNPTSADQGTHTVIVEVADGRGSSAQQRYVLSVIEPPPNRPPVFTSVPEVEAHVNTIYTYQATATDQDADTLTFSMSSGPADLTIDPATGLITWSPTASQLGTQNVSVTVSDGRGGTASQAYTIRVEPETSNRPPVIVSTPRTSVVAEVPPEDQTIRTITFEGIPASPSFFQGIFVPAEARLSDHFLATHGVTFSSASGVPHVGVIRLGAGHAHSGVNGIGGMGSATNIDYATPIVVEFFLPADSGTAFVPAVTDFVSIKVDTAGAQGTVFLEGYDINGSLLGRTSAIDNGGPTLALSAPGIHTAKIRGTSTTAFDDLSFGPLYPVALYTYDVDALDPDLDVLTYSLDSAPEGMNIDQSTGLVSWAIPAIRRHTIKIDPRSTYLHTFDDPAAQDSVPIALATLGISGGDLVRLEAIGDYAAFGTDNEIRTSMIGAFSAGSVLSASSAAHRVPGALDVPADVLTTPTSRGNEPTDIPEDFNILTGTVAGTVLQVPLQATHLFVGPFDTLFGDNSDADNDYFLRISRLPSYEVTVRVDDGRAGTDTQSFSIEVTETVTAEIRGTSFNDADGSGTRGAGEPGLAGWTVYLDENRNGLRDQSERFAATDSDGTYTFDDLPPGVYMVAQEGQRGWEQTAPSARTHEVTVVRGSVADGNDFGNRQRDQSINRAPVFNSTPPLEHRAGETYRYLVSATDPDGDVLHFDLPVRPTGMEIDGSSGALVWRPTADQLGFQDVIVRARDGQEVTLQAFQINVTPANTAPVITSVSPGPIVAGHPFEYHVRAQDADGDVPRFALGQGPAGMTVGLVSGVLQWTPGASQTGLHPVSVTAFDARGGAVTTSFQLEVVADAPNQPPVIHSEPRTRIGLGGTYLYSVEASDTNHDPIMLTLATAPAGMTLDPVTRLMRWEPTPDQVGDHSVEIRADDGRGGATTQSFVVSVVTAATNQPPQIVSTPLMSGTADRPYAYRPLAEDAEGDPLVWTLTTAPRGMSIDADLGTIHWTPSIDQVGQTDVIVEVTDAQGGRAQQVFIISVRGANLPPAILSVPSTQGSVGQVYDYPVRATDADADALRFLLTIFPTGMTIDESSGLIRWTPSPTQVGPQDVVVGVTDGQGGSATQSFTVVVAAAPVNHPPIVTTVPATAATLNHIYHYDVDASDPEGDSLTFALSIGPTGMTIDSNTGVITWTPTASQVGNHRVTLTVADGAGNRAGQSYTLVVQPANRAPSIDSEAVPSTTAGLVYRYDLQARDPDENALTYRLSSGPAGMIIDALGRISWPTAIADIGMHAVEVTVADPFGASASQRFEVTVSPDTQGPSVIVEFSTSPVDLGAEVILFVSASDNVGVEEMRLTVDGIPVAVDAHGRATFHADQVGAFEVVAQVTDAAGNTQTTQETLIVIDPTDANAPEVALTNPADDAIITAPAAVRGTVTDDNLLFYTLSVAPVGSSQFVEFARGTANVANDVLGTVDPTLLQNDSYVLRLEATDAGGNISAVEQELHVAGDLKLGNFAVSFTDLTVPVFGVPITVARSYDTLTAQQSGDFGFGWRLEFRNMNLRTSVAPTGFEEYGIFNPLEAGSRVYLTLPGGSRQGFTFEPALAAGIRGGFLGIFEPRFVPDAGVKSSLTVTPADLRIGADGRVFDYATGIPYNPASGLFGGSYLLTTKEGIVFDVDGQTGQLTAMSDASDNILTFTDAGISGPDGVSVRFERDPRGRITSVIDPAGHRITYQYDARGDLVAVTDRTGNATQFTYYSSPAHYLEKVIDPLGRTGVRSEYDAQGRLVQLIDAAGNPMHFTSDPANLVATVTDQLGNTFTEEYDARGNILQTVDALGNVTRRTFDADNNMLTETDPLGRTTTFTYNDRGDAITETDPLGNTTRATFEAFTYGTTPLAAVRGEASAPFTRVRTSTDALGNTHAFAYNHLGNMTVNTDPAGHVIVIGYDKPGGPPISMTDAAGNVTQFQYAFGRLVRQVNPLGHVTSFTYDANGNELTLTSTQTAADGTVRTLTTRTEYDAEGRVTAVIDAEGGVTRSEYDAVGNRTAKIDALGRRTVYRYDERDELVETIFPDQTPADLSDNPRTQSEYDDVGRETARIDELGRRTEYVYDAAGRLVKTVYPDNTPANPLDNPFTQTQYDAAGQVTAEVDERGHRTEFDYDVAGQQILVRDALGHQTLISYDPVGRRAQVTDALGHLTQFRFDERGLPVETIYPDGTSISSTYNALRQRIAQTDEQDATTRYEYDALGRITAVVDALGHRTEYTLDEAGSVVRATDANGHTTTYQYDGRNRLVVTTFPLGEQWVTTYDAVGNVASRIDANGQTIDYEYDARNRLTTKLFPDSSVVTFTYTPTGERETVTDARGTTTYVYDERDRLLARTEPDGTQIGYLYDDAGNRTAVTTPAGTTSYTFDPLNRLETVRDSDGQLTRYSYDAGGHLVRTEFPNGLLETRQYDERSRLTFLEQSASTGVLASYRYTLTATGRRSAVEEQGGRRVDYTYDPVGRLTREAITDAVLGDLAIDYLYDAAGNRLTRNDSAQGLTEYVYDDNDRLLSETLASEVTEYTYDNNGNTLSRVSATDQVFYDWDFENHLIAADVTDAGGTRHLDYRYDVDGLRVASAIDGEETRYLIDANRPVAQVLLEYTPGGILQASYVYGHGLIAQNRADGPSFYLPDGLGSIRTLTTSAGLVSDRYLYDAFGVQLLSQGTTINTYRFVGEQYDPHLDLIYLRARYLSPQQGRFASRDPFPGLWSEPTTLHRFLYVGADPVNRIDPTGLFFLIELNIGFNIQTGLAVAGGVYGGFEGYKIGGLKGAVIGAIVGLFLGSTLARFRFGAAPLTPTASTASTASLTAREAAYIERYIASQQGVNQVVTHGVREVATKGVKFWKPGGGAGAVLPLPAFVDIFRQTKEEPDGDVALCVMSSMFSQLALGADPYTGELYETLAVSLEAAGGESCKLNVF